MAAKGGDLSLRPTRIVLPTPFAVGPVNAYVYALDPVTVVDPGPLYPPAQRAFEQGLAQAGVAIGDIRQVIVTHHHPDHAGYAPLLAERCGAVLRMHPEAALRTASPRGDEEASEALLRRHGVPKGILVAMRRELSRIVSFMAPLSPFAPVLEGDLLAAGGDELEAFVLPGHAPGHLCLQAASYMLGGDLLIEGITPNPIFEVGPEGRRPSLQEYRTSLERVRSLPSVPWLPGHRGDVGDPIGLIDSYEAQMSSRQETVRGLLAQGPKSAFALSQELFPMERGADPFLAISETLGQLDALKDAGRVLEEAAGPHVLFKAV